MDCFFLGDNQCSHVTGNDVILKNCIDDKEVARTELKEEKTFTTETGIIVQLLFLDKYINFFSFNDN
ncbi:hypothetical protein MAR_010135, partial [Mya arenaria]